MERGPQAGRRFRIPLFPTLRPPPACDPVDTLRFFVKTIETQLIPDKQEENGTAGQAQGQPCKDDHRIGFGSKQVPVCRFHIIFKHVTISLKLQITCHIPSPVNADLRLPSRQFMFKSVTPHVRWRTCCSLPLHHDRFPERPAFDKGRGSHGPERRNPQPIRAISRIMIRVKRSFRGLISTERNRVPVS